MGTFVLLVALTQAPALPPAPSSVFKAGVVAVVASAVADVVTTTAAVYHGAREANPAMRPFVGSTVGLAAVKAGGTAAVLTAAYGLRRNGHPKLATGILWGVAAGWTAAAIWNATR